MSRQILILVEALLQEVLDCFDVMVSRALNFFNPLSVLNRELSENWVHEGLLWCNLLDGYQILRDNLLIEQGLEPAQLHKDAEPHQSILREVGSEWVTTFGVSAIDWAYCCQGADWGDFSGLRRLRERRHALLWIGERWSEETACGTAELQVEGEARAGESWLAVGEH